MVITATIITEWVTRKVVIDALEAVTKEVVGITTVERAVAEFEGEEWCSVIA